MNAMRLGILEIGGDAGISALMEALKARDIDVITAESPITDTGAALKEGARIGRADCDGVILCPADGAKEWHILGSISHLSCPLLLAGSPDSVVRADRELGAQNIPADRLDADLATVPVDKVADWLHANRKTERQPGIEAAHKLYGLRLAVPEERLYLRDRHLWFRHFGIVLVPQGEEAEITADDGDALTSVTIHLLRLIADSDPIILTPGTDAPPDHTLVQIRELDGQFAGLVNPPLPVASVPVVAIPGDRRIAIQAAFHTLAMPLLET